MDRQKLSENRHIEIAVSIEDAKTYLQETMVLSRGTIATFYNIWKQLIPYMKSRDIPYYTPEVGKDFLTFRHQDMGIAFSENWGSRMSLAIRRLEEFYSTGKIYKKEKFHPHLIARLVQA